MARQRAKNQNVGAKAETKLNSQQKNPHMKSGRFLPNLSEIGLTTMLPMKNPTKNTEVETNPSEPRSQKRSNCGKFYKTNTTMNKTNIHVNHSRCEYLCVLPCVRCGAGPWHPRQILKTCNFSMKAMKSNDTNLNIKTNFCSRIWMLPR